MTKKLSLKDIFTESDVLQQNQELKFAVLQQIPKLQQLVMQNIKRDEYQGAIKALEQLEVAVRTAKDQLKMSVQKKSAPSVPSQVPASQSISSKEI